ncbi:MAG: haloalkane dehalogenase [Ulvibacter sp.]|jgi:haloalkane dehalogenase
MIYKNFRASQKTFQSVDGALKYIDIGSGEVLLLLHGVPTSGWLYRNMIDDLAKNHRVIVPDMLGYGSSDSPKGYEIYSEDRHAQRLLDLMDFINIRNWTHVMHDAGGLWTWTLFRKQPERIKRLVILNTIIYKEGFKPPMRFRQGIIAQIFMWSYRNGITTNLMLKGLFKSGMITNTLSKTDIEGYRKPLLEGKTNGIYYFFTQTCNSLTDFRQTIQKINIPVKVIWGQHDAFLKWDPQSEDVIADLGLTPNKIHLLNAKHFIQEEKPSEIVQLILAFIN